MKILQVGKFYYPAVGGIETVVRDLSEGLKSKQVDVTVLCFANGITKVTETVHFGVKVIQIPCTVKIFSQPLSLSYAQVLRRIAPQFDLIHVHSPNPFAEVLAAFLPKEIPLVVTYHADAIRQKLLFPFYRPALRHFLKKCKYIVTATQYLVSSSPVLRSFKKKSLVIPFGLKLSHENITADVLKRAEEIHKKLGSYILFTGRLVPYKGITYLIDAMSILKTKMPRLKLVVIGEGPLYRTLLAQVKRLGLESHVVIKGAVHDPVYFQAHYYACDLFVLPSISQAEAFGLVLLEAMSYSKAVISTRIPSGVQEVNLENVTGVSVEPRDPQGLAKAIATLMQDMPLRTQMGANGRLHVLHHFTHSKMIEKYLTLYSEVIQKNPRNRRPTAPIKSGAP